MSNLLIDFMLEMQGYFQPEEEPPEIFPGTREQLDKLTIRKDDDDD